LKLRTLSVDSADVRRVRTALALRGAQALRRALFGFFAGRRLGLLGARASGAIVHDDASFCASLARGRPGPRDGLDVRLVV